MRATLLIITLVTLVPSLHAQRADAGALPSLRSTAVVAGLGNSMGWLGLQGEKYLGNDQLSLFGGIGYTPASFEGDANGVTVAAGLRGYTPGVRHRGFLEVSVAQIEAEQACFARCRRAYGPGVQIGYQFVASGGFTASFSGGIGWAPTGSRDAAALIGLGFGYTWRR